MSDPALTKPNLEIAKKVLPLGLLTAIEYIFQQQVSDAMMPGVMLVGGTALSGFYAGHRRSDDIDLFTKSETAFQATILAVESLKGVGATFTNTSHSKQYFQTLCEFHQHHFTIDVVLDTNLFRVGNSHQIGTLRVADLPTLFKMKAATLVSRCSEKDLFDLHWLLQNLPDTHDHLKRLTLDALEIDAGASIESMLISLSGTNLSVEACNFAIHTSAQTAYQVIIDFRKHLIASLKKLHDLDSNAPLKQAIRAVKKLR